MAGRIVIGTQMIPKKKVPNTTAIVRPRPARMFSPPLTRVITARVVILLGRSSGVALFSLTFFVGIAVPFIYCMRKTNACPRRGQASLDGIRTRSLSPALILDQIGDDGDIDGFATIGLNAPIHTNPPEDKTWED